MNQALRADKPILARKGWFTRIGSSALILTAYIEWERLFVGVVAQIKPNPVDVISDNLTCLLGLDTGFRPHQVHHHLHQQNGPEDKSHNAKNDDVNNDIEQPDKKVAGFHDAGFHARHTKELPAKKNTRPVVQLVRHVLLKKQGRRITQSRCVC
jgi:hypothetical protein